MQIDIELFGAMRAFHTKPSVSVDAEGALTMGEVKARLTTVLEGEGDQITKVLARSVLADEETIYQDDAPFEGQLKLAILPPVAGG